MDLPLWQWLAVFAGAAGILVWAGTRLAAAGDEIATKTGLGGLLVGALLTSAATSLPELVTDVSAVVNDAPSLAIGDLFGSSMANMAILAIIDLVARRRVWPTVELGHARVAAVAIVLTSLAVLGVVTPSGPAIGWIGLDTVAIAGIYVGAVAWFRRARGAATVDPSGGVAVGSEIPTATGWSAAGGGGDVRPAAIRFGVAAAVVFAVGPVVAISGEGIAETSGLGVTFVGAAFLAVATSLPELVASLAAVRIGAYDLAVGNLFGSNAVNMAMLVLIDAAYLDGPLLGAAGSVEIVAGVGAILLMAVALAAVVHGEETRIYRLEPDAVLLLVAYVGAMVGVATVG
ncbi:MAG TPA: hypothetical protein VLA82_07080 [Actinomycetota bacterium]|nr:hypothetical protein [Actinomycetota bacterium]